MLHAFLSRNRLLPDQTEIPDLIPAFLNEMEKGLSGEESSLLMIPSYAYLPDSAPKAKSAAVIDAGGTNLRIALVRFDSNGDCGIESFEQYNMPGTRGEISKDRFFEELAGYLGKIIGKADAVAVSFAYPTEILPNGDGRILKLVKEVKVTGIEGCILGEELSSALKNAGHPVKRIYVTNDTVATALSGVTENHPEPFNRYIGVIEGTGTNVCYPELTSNIRKLKSLNDNRRMMINTESGGFDKLALGQADIDFTNTTKDPKYHILEKLVSGGYLGGLVAETLYAAAKDGIISRPASHKKLIFDTRDISEYMNGVEEAKINAYISADEDKQKIDDIINAIIDRTATLLTLQISGAILKCATSGERVYINIEGSTYYKLPTLRMRTEEKLFAFTRKKNIYVELHSVSDAVIKGSAIVALQ